PHRPGPMVHPALAAAAALCGLAVGLATNRLLAERRDAEGAARRGTWGAAPRDGRPRGLWLASPLLLAAASVGLALLPGLERPLALSQALLLLYVLYPLALVDATTLTVEPALVLGGIVLRMATVLALQREAAADAFGGLLAGAGLLALVGFAYAWLRGREGLGEGDPAVLGLVGAFVGWQGLLPVVLLATAAGLVGGVAALLLLRKPLDTPLPFGPYLCAGGLAVYLAQAQGWLLFGAQPGLG
ncbi:MAG TPA: A24 family peptidase, partial [bacterium]